MVKWETTFLSSVSPSGIFARVVEHCHRRRRDGRPGGATPAGAVRDPSVRVLAVGDVLDAPGRCLLVGSADGERLKQAVAASVGIEDTGLTITPCGGPAGFELRSNRRRKDDLAVVRQGDIGCGAGCTCSEVGKRVVARADRQRRRELAGAV